MTNNSEILDVLNDLLRINNDRIEGYKKAQEETDESDLRSLFERMANQSRKIVMTLINEITSLGGEPAIGSTTNPGKIYRVWMDVKATFNGGDREGVLNACEFGEDAAQAAYKTALENDDLSPAIREVIWSQKDELKDSHDEIKEKRDQVKYINL
jgi:uncharacterized protein (TIGR02284 family)